MNAWDWWAQASRQAKVASGGAASLAALGLVLGLSHLDRSLTDPAPALTPAQIDWNIGYDLARHHLARGDSRDLAREKCLRDVHATLPGTNTRTFRNGCRASASNWEDSDWPAGAPTQGD